jgi:hypothetical protein
MTVHIFLYRRMYDTSHYDIINLKITFYLTKDTINLYFWNYTDNDNHPILLKGQSIMWQTLKYGLFLKFGSIKIWTVSPLTQLTEDGYEPTIVPVTLVRGAYPSHIKRILFCNDRNFKWQFIF